MVAYLVLAGLCNMRNHKSVEHPHKPFIQQIFDAATFALSVALLMGVIDPDVLKLIGNLTMFILICGIAGIAYSIRSLFK